MTPTQLAALAAAITTLLAGCIPADRARDRQARSWLPKRWVRYRLLLLLVQLGATAILAAGAMQIGWQPESHASGFSAAAQGVAWSIAAVAVLRADVTGCRVEDATPGFTLLRSISDHLTGSLVDDLRDAVRAHLPHTAPELRERGLDCKAQAHPPRSDGTLTPDAKALGANIVLLADASELNDLRELIVNTIQQGHLTKWK